MRRLNMNVKGIGEDVCELLLATKGCNLGNVFSNLIFEYANSDEFFNILAKEIKPKDAKEVMKKIQKIYDEYGISTNDKQEEPAVIVQKAHRSETNIESSKNDENPTPNKKIRDAFNNK